VLLDASVVAAQMLRVVAVFMDAKQMRTGRKTGRRRTHTSVPPERQMGSWSAQATCTLQIQTLAQTYTQGAGVRPRAPVMMSSGAGQCAWRKQREQWWW
jgi:hypothetical protein